MLVGEIMEGLIFSKKQMQKFGLYFFKDIPIASKYSEISFFFVSLNAVNLTLMLRTHVTLR